MAVERLFDEIYNEPLSGRNAWRLTRHFEGWAAGLAMFHLLGAGKPPVGRRRLLAELPRGRA
jgi:ATP/maltotriose-dependent transcriptional regulator MalT